MPSRRTELPGLGQHRPPPGPLQPGAHLFYEPTNLVASCGRCNYSDGARVATRNTRTTISRLEEVIAYQAQEIEVLIDRLHSYENPAGNGIAKDPPNPVIY
jgi:hypothetical protein